MCFMCYLWFMKLIVGLGNPGDKYQNTRHNIGFVMLDQFLDSNKIKDFSYDNKYGWELSIWTNNWEKIIFLKPMEYMNKSGSSVQKLMSFYRIQAKDLLVIHDDIDLVVGIVKFKTGGWLAGHNGLKDIVEKIWSKGFARIRIWVGRPSHPSQDVADYVLWNFKKDEIEIIQDKYLDIDRMLLAFIS